MRNRQGEEEAFARRADDVLGKLRVEADLRDTAVADIKGWSPDRIAGIPQVYVDQEKLIVAIGGRINHGLVKRPAMRSEG